MPCKIDMCGQKCGSLYVLEEIGMYVSPGQTTHDRTWLCVCDCGNKCVVRGSYLRNGHTKTCGNCGTQTIVDETTYMRCFCKNGGSFIFDSSDLPIVCAHIWYMDSNGYVITKKGRQQLKLHRLLMCAPDGMVVDHINGNTGDCRKCNLRIVTQHVNTYNSGMRKTSTTGYKGVCYDRRRAKYMAHIHPNGKMKFLGYYASPEAAAEAYNNAAMAFFGEGARLNVVGTPFITKPAKNRTKRRDAL